jgi:ribosomal protein L11 methyltransferase
MLEGLPPNNAAHKLTLTIDERRARAVADLIVESFEPAEAASTVFETEAPWPGGGKTWLVEVYFGFPPDEEAIRALIAVAADEETARAAQFGLIEKRDWVANALAGLAPVRAGRFLVHGGHDRQKVGANDIGIEIEAGLAFGTGHHGTTRGCLLLFDRLLKRRRADRVLDVGCGAGVLAIAAAKALRRKVQLGDVDPVAVEVANANARLNGVPQFCRAIVSRGVENRLLREGAPYDVVFANILSRPLKLLAPSLAAVIAPHGEAIVSGLLAADVPGALAAWRAQGLFLAERIDLDGWASLNLTPAVLLSRPPRDRRCRSQPSRRQRPPWLALAASTSILWNRSYARDSSKMAGHL